MEIFGDFNVRVMGHEGETSASFSDTSQKKKEVRAAGSKLGESSRQLNKG